jgi:hypothetical protein
MQWIQHTKFSYYIYSCTTKFSTGTGTCIQVLNLNPAVKKAIVLLLSHTFVKFLKDALAHFGGSISDVTLIPVEKILFLCPLSGYLYFFRYLGFFLISVCLENQRSFPAHFAKWVSSSRL